MLKLTKTGIGLLTRQYRSVLKKCWAINAGVWQTAGNITSRMHNTMSYMLSLLDSLLNIKSTTFDAKRAENVPAAELLQNAPTVAGTSIFFRLKNIDVIDELFAKRLFNKKFATLTAIGLAVATTAAPTEAEAGKWCMAYNASAAPLRLVADNASCPSGYSVYGTQSGVNSTALGPSATAGKPSATASGVNSIALGPSATASNYYSIALGPSATASNYYSIALGSSATASAASSVALGVNANVSGESSIALGSSATASATNSVALGLQAKASGLFSTALGNGATASGDQSTALGDSAKATGSNSTALGRSARAYGTYSIAQGYGAYTGYKENKTTDYSNPTTEPTAAIAIGQYAGALTDYSIALGYLATAGQGNKADESTNAIAIGNGASASAANSVALGANSVANAENTVSVGSSGSERRIMNVAAGTANTDAVNLGQMNTALAGKQATISGAASTITSSNLTANRALVSDASGKVAVSSVTSTELGYLSGVTSNIQTQLNNKQATITDLATIRSNASNGATAYTNLGDVNYRDESAVSGSYLRKGTSGTASPNTVRLALDALDSAIQTKQNTISGAASTITSSNLTANRALVSDASGKVAVSSVTSTELGYLSGVTSNIQTQLNNKQATITDLATIRSNASNGATAYTNLGDVNYRDESAVSGSYLRKGTSGTASPNTVRLALDALDSAIQTKQNTISGAASTITSSNLTANKALVSDASGKVAVSSVTSTELGYLSGVTSNIQTQLNNKQATITDLDTIRSNASNGATAYTNLGDVNYRDETAVSGSYLRKGTSGTASPNTVRLALDALDSAIQTKQNTINASNKLSASFVSGLATVATSGSYSDLSNKPSLGTAAAKDVDTTVTANSANLITSGGVATALNNYYRKMRFAG